MSATNGPTETDEQQLTITDETTRHEKDVVITAYGSPEHENQRVFIHEVFGQYLDDGVDFFSETVETQETFRMELSFEGVDPEYGGEPQEFSEEFSYINSSTRRALRRAINQGKINPDEVEWLDVEIEETVSTHFDESLAKPLKQLVKTHAEDITTPEELGYEDYAFGIGDVHWQQEVDVETPDASEDQTEALNVRIDACRDREVERRRVLAHQSERSPSKRFETPAEVPEEERPWSVQFTVRLETLSEDHMEQLSEAIVNPLYQRLAHTDGIEKVRLSNCSVVKREEGECYGL